MATMDTGTSTSTSTGQVRDVNLVVARFTEDIGWLREVVSALEPANVMVHLYDKGLGESKFDLGDIMSASGQGSGSRAGSVSVTVTRLPNVGRESHTFLEHVHRMRGRARAHVKAGTDTSITVFLQGHMHDHVPGDHASLAAFVAWMVADASASIHGESGNHACHTQFGTFNAHPDMRVAMFPGVGDSDLTLKSWFTTYIGPWVWSDPSEGPSWWQNGVFAIQSARFLAIDGARGKADESRFRALQLEVSWHVNPEQGHFFERSWRYVFQPVDDVVNGNVDPGAPSTELSPPVYTDETP